MTEKYTKRLARDNIAKITHTVALVIYAPSFFDSGFNGWFGS